jgi:hypothetical protein
MNIIAFNFYQFLWSLQSKKVFPIFLIILLFFFNKLEIECP